MRETPNERFGSDCRSLEAFSLDECTDALRQICLGEMVPALSHEIGNILTVLNGIRQVVLEEGEAEGRGLADVSERYAGVIATQVTHSEGLSNRLRSLMRPANQGEQPLVEIRDQVADLLTLRARGRQIRIVREGATRRSLGREAAHHLELVFLAASQAVLGPVFAARAPGRITLAVSTRGGDGGQEETGLLECVCRLKGGARDRGHSRGCKSTARLVVALADEVARRHDSRLDVLPDALLLESGHQELVAGNQLGVRLTMRLP